MKKISILALLMLTIVFLSCEEDSFENREQQTSIEQIDFKIETLNRLYNQDKRLKKSIDRIKSSKEKSTASSIYNFGIYENKVQVFEQNHYTQYTFEVYRDTPNSNILENYVLKLYDDDSVEQFLVTYDVTQELSYAYNTIETIYDPDLILPKTIGCYPELIDSFQQTECTPIYCSIHPNGGNGCDNDGGTPIDYVDCETYTVYVYANSCDGGGNSDSGSSGSSNPPNSGGDVPNGGSNLGDGGTSNPDLSDPGTTITSPMTIMSLEVKIFINTLPQDQQDWINGLNDCSATSIGGTSSCNQELWQEIIGFLNGNIEDGELSQETSIFFDDLMNILINSDFIEPDFTASDYPGKDQGLPFEWWKDQNYMQNNFAVNGVIPNEHELLLFAILPTPITLMHIQNSNTALDKAVELVNDGTLTGIADGKADAFRHGFWNALGTVEFGSDLMKILADAHEKGEVGISVDMDLFNNNIGRIIGTGLDPFFESDEVVEQAILDAMALGELVYIVNGSLIPTNQ